LNCYLALPDQRPVHLLITGSAGQHHHPARSHHAQGQVDGLWGADAVDDEINALLEDRDVGESRG
jgi:hypothetical protein